MNKGDLIEAVAKDLKASKAAAERAVSAVIDNIARGLKKDKKVQLVGFGTFDVRKRKPRKGRNPRTGEAITIKASKSVGFKAGQVLKSNV
ncbi:MAG: HU family DNA-binding protein [Candidatus Abyssobacteria bacterium SURF_5]|jgi:DNA-binding protein HU-beta|uniref:HU family DNA-binding protein n=1 Tax=Abyssobacteria bacterium (strain SURF_5) TaxID=2093360 RepID=A0A3A4P6N2_ABYX5|nr:MAG: HU family DNA-binding protein [Candidatus Abyssubacteria bacterium SURF_5]